MLLNRVAAARAVLEASRADYILFLNLYQIRYLSGFTGSDAAVVVGHDNLWFLTDSRYTVQARIEAEAFTVSEYRGKIEGIASLIKGQGGKRIAFEAEHMTVSFFRSLSAALPEIELIPLSSELENLRIRKDSEEVSLLEESARIASTAFNTLLDLVRPGAVERDLAQELEFLMRRGGADHAAFDFIVASGERGALPHGRASDKILAAGELITFDYGGVKDGYCSDETVTIGIGPLDTKHREIYQIVKDAHDRALEAVRPGIAFSQLDNIARDLISSKGYGDFFGHGLGHGVGLEVHEKPVVSFRSEAVVEEGMVFTIEPGIYIPGWGGVRIEDTVCATIDGPIVLTKVAKDLLVL